MTDAVESRPHTAGVVASLQAAQVRVGKGVGRDDEGNDLVLPYAVVYPQGGDLMGTLDAPESDGELTWAVTYVAETQAQCEWLRDVGRAALLASFAVDGRAIVRVKVDQIGEVGRDDDVEPPLFFCPERYRAWSTAASTG